MSKHDTVEHIQEAFNADFVRLVQSLIAIKGDKTMSARIRKWAVLYVANSFLEGLPILNADPDLLAPINAIINDLAGPQKKGGRDRAFDMLVHEARATVEILRKEGWTARSTYDYIADIMTKTGRPVTPATVKDWMVGARTDDEFAKVKIVTDYITNVWTPSIVRDDLTMTERARMHFEFRARRWAKFED
ncbi:hypothetical protein GS610_08150 [Ruegeria sp. HKCCD6228]|uniref:hypothetical protein n=1 Tax=Ruegeria sp. HKCCD6228 TaxID=2683001 RepID=UPI0014912B8A|nr:hypothetical protein [Ruegeria sp. HKCCD6228]NOD97179.1 hypothetical protein [Ruegeria sp. HKCCD6228]